MRDVSRETEERLKHFAALLDTWTRKINLIAPGTRGHIWERHIEDSLQLFPLAPDNWRHWVDLGSGGGLPGVVIAILASDGAEGRQVTLIESDARKCAFLRTALRETGTPGRVVNGRIEDAPQSRADVVSARALAPLPKLLELASHHMAPTGVALLPKGKMADREVHEALERWSFACEKHPSTTDAEGVVLRIGELSCRTPKGKNNPKS